MFLLIIFNLQYIRLDTKDREDWVKCLLPREMGENISKDSHYFLQIIFYS